MLHVISRPFHALLTCTPTTPSTESTHWTPLFYTKVQRATQIPAKLESGRKARPPHCACASALCPPHPPSQRACALGAREPGRAPRGASARGLPVRARAPAACSRRRRRRAPLRRPGPSARRLSRSLGPTHLLRRRPGPAAGPDGAAGVAAAAAATRAGRAAAEGEAATAGTRSPGRAAAAAAAGEAGAAAVAAAAAPRRGRPRSRPPPSPRAGVAAARAPAAPPQAREQAVAPARSPLWARKGGGGRGGPAYPAAWRSLRSPWRPRGPALAAPFRRRRRLLLLREPSGGRGPDCAAAERAEPVLSRGGRRRRETHKEGGERAPRGRAGGDGSEAWIGPSQGKRVGIGGLRLVEP